MGASTAPSVPPMPDPPPVVPGAMRVLFMGNSLTYVENMPSLVARLAIGAGLQEPTVATRAGPNYGLEDHWNEGIVQDQLQRGGYQVLVMQQGPSSLAESRADLIPWVQRWADEARRHGTRPAVYAVWTPRGGDLDASITNYTDAATGADAALYPAGHAWREAWRTDPLLPLYSADQFHQSETGAYLVALVIAAQLFDRPPADFPNLFPQTISPARDAALKEAARVAIERYGVR